MLSLLRRPSAAILLSLLVLLLLADQLNHWTAPSFFYLQAWWWIPIVPALYLSLIKGTLITFIAALLAECYVGFDPGTLLFVLLVIHFAIFLNRETLCDANGPPSLFIPLMVIVVGSVLLLILTPLFLLGSGAFWFRFTADLGYNLIAFAVLSPLIFKFQYRLLRGRTGLTALP